MVFVFMGEKYGVQFSYSCSQHLLSEIRPGIHDKRLTFYIDVNRRSQPFVSVIQGLTDHAIAPDDRYALGSASS